MAHLHDLVVAIQFVGLNRRVALLHMAGQGNLDRRRQLTRLASTFQGHAYRIRMRHVTLQGFLDSGLQFGGTITIEQV